MMTQESNWVFLRNVLIKTAILFVLLNAAFALVYPRELLGSLSGYNWLFPGRSRFPHSDVPDKAFNITTSNLEAMFYSHLLSVKGEEEFRVVIIGDSSVWGFLQDPDETFTSILDQMGLSGPEGEPVRFYNLGYPTLSVTKDLLLLERSLEFQPDMVLWFVTLESVVESTQLESPLLQHNSIQVKRLVSELDLEMQGDDNLLRSPSLYQRSIVGSREELSELYRLQLYGFAWAATGVDHYIPESYNQRMEDLSEDIEYKDMMPGEMSRDFLYFEAIEAGMDVANGIPVMIVNEPIFISDGENSDLRYNFFYPRWAYDRYRRLFEEKASSEGWHYRDYWDLIPASEFTDSAIHYSTVGSKMMAELIAQDLAAEFQITKTSK